MNKVFCFGELLLRISPALNGEWINQSSMAVYIGGAELNVANALAKWNIPAKYCSAIPDHYLSREIMDALESKHIDTSAMQLNGERIGTYYLPQGADLKHAGVIYDRAHSSFSQLQPGMIDWDKALAGCHWFHFSAISPALLQSAADVCKEALEAASNKGLIISVDLNYRSKLWQYGKSPVEIMPELISYCDVVMGNIWAAETLAGIAAPIKESTGKSKDELVDAAANSMQQLMQRYSRVRAVAYTFRLQEEYFGVISSNGNIATSAVHKLGIVVDKVGSGDCFMAGIICGLYNQYDLDKTIDFAAAAAVGKLYEKGDATQQSIESILQKINYAN